MTLNANEKVLVVGGPFTGWLGQVLSVETRQQLVTVAINVFGKSIAIQLQASQVRADTDGGSPHTPPPDSPSDPDAPVRDPRALTPGGKVATASLVEPETNQHADATQESSRTSRNSGTG